MSKLLSSIILPSILDEDETEPHKQHELSPDKIREKEAKLFDQAMMLVTSNY